MKFAGFDDWFEVFRIGTHTDSAGNTRTWTEADLEKIAASYNPAEHEAPVVVGHPSHDAPAYGWAEALKVEGGVLYARVKDVVTEFADMVRRGLFKKRSIALYPDMTLRHIGFLGAMPPAVKGLKDISFKDPDGVVTIEFSEGSWAWDSLARMLRRLREYFIEKEGVEKADALLPEYTIEDIKSAATPAQEAELYAEKEEKGMKEPGKESPPQTFSEADVERIRAEAKAEGKKEAEATFAETQRQERAKTVKADIAAFCDSLKKEGKLVPAWEKLGLQQFMESLDAETVIEFAEGDAGKKTRLDFMKAFLSEIPRVVSFGEIAGREKDTLTGTAGDKLDTLARQKMGQNNDLTYRMAFAEVQKDNPDLAKQYEIELKGGE